MISAFATHLTPIHVRPLEPSNINSSVPMRRLKLYSMWQHNSVSHFVFFLKANRLQCILLNFILEKFSYRQAGQEDNLSLYVWDIAWCPKTGIISRFMLDILQSIKWEIKPLTQLACGKISQAWSLTLCIVTCLPVCIIFTFRNLKVKITII